MAKVIKAKKSQFYLLNQLMAKIPKQSYEEGSLKIMNFFRAVKAILRKYIDEVAELNKTKMEKIKEETREYQIAKAEHDSLPEDKKAEKLKLKRLMEKIDAVAGEKIKEENDKLQKIQDDLNEKHAEVTFDNEDFLFVENAFKKNPGLFQVENKEGEAKGFDLDTMDTIIEMFDSATIPKVKGE